MSYQRKKKTRKEKAFNKVEECHQGPYYTVFYRCLHQHSVIICYDQKYNILAPVMQDIQ